MKEDRSTMGQARKRSEGSPFEELARVEGTAIDQASLDGHVMPEQMFAEAEALGGVRGLALAIFSLAAFDRYRLRRRRKGRELEPWMRRDGWTPDAGREAEEWFENPGDEMSLGSLAWVRVVLGEEHARARDPRPRRQTVELLRGVFAG